MKHASSRELYEHWGRLRGAGRAPQRSVVEPYDLRRILGDVFILEVVDHATYRFRLAGTQLCATHGRELKGEDFLELFSDTDIRSVASLLLDVTEAAAAGVLGTVAHSRSGRTVALELLLLPLASDAAPAADRDFDPPGFDRIIGVMPAMERPFWLGSDPIVSHDVTSLRLLQTEVRPRPLIPTGRVIAVEPLPLQASHPRPGLGRFTVLEGGKR